MASSEVDQKYLGRFAKETSDDNPLLSAMLFKILGLSVVLSRKLIRARRLRKLDTTRDTKSLSLYHHILWLSREGLVIVEQYVIPMVEAQQELKVLGLKLRASFYHIFVLFHNHPSINHATIPLSANSSSGNKGKAAVRDSPQKDEASDLMEGGPVGGSFPPGIPQPIVPKSTGTFLLPAMDYIPTASACFSETSKFADRLLPGSHPLRLSVKVEQAAFLYDCVKDQEASRRLARNAIADVYNAQEAMDDEMFEDAAEMVKTLGKMMKRGLGGTPGSTPLAGSQSTPGSKSTPRMSGSSAPAVQSPGIERHA